MAKAGAATVAAADVEPRNACIAPWLGVPREAAIAGILERRLARRRHGRTGGSVRALAVARPAAATVAAAVLELRNACIALWTDVPRGATAWKNRRRPSCACGYLVGGRDGGGRRARAAQCAHCALAGRSARGGGRDGSRATARAATARGKPAAVFERWR
ncbi:hypothetical protein [Burkholderia gladioli]|uniref:hypothetical protein n=1 Tax=Burkholderia gladioli TaxID=28095 RepID=UPI000F543B2B|nr:hypothetical protein [Burkholderia gladioli]